MTERNSTSKAGPLLIVALAFALNLHGLAADSFWGDEILTATFASLAPTDVIHWTAEDIHPPFYYLVAGTFTKLTTPLGAISSPSVTSDWLWRFPSAMAGVLAVAGTYRLANLIFNRCKIPAQPTAVFAALLLAVAPVAIKYGQEARMHALFMLLSALSTWLFFRAISRPPRWSRWLLFGLATAANIYTMYFGFLILAAQTGYLLLSVLAPNYKSRQTQESSPRRVIAGFAAAVTVAFLLYLPWWPVLFDILRKRAAVGAIEGGVGSPLDFGWGFVTALGPQPPVAAWGFLLLFVLGLFFLLRLNWPLAVFSLLWLALPALLPLLLGDPRALQFRYAFVLPIYLTIIAFAVVQLGRVVGPTSSPVTGLSGYLIWILATVSFISTLGIYQQTKPNWREAAAYLDEQAVSGDVILIGPLWDEGRFIDYYYRGQAQLLTPAALVTNIERRAEELRANGGRVWAINRFAPTETAAISNVDFGGVVISEPALPVYEPALLTQAAIDLAAEAVEAAQPWAAQADAQGVLDPDPRTARAAALRALGDVLMAADQPQAAIVAYQEAVDIFPGWVNGFIALAEAHQASGNLPAAVGAYQQAVTFNLRWQGPEAEEAVTLAQSGQWEIALEKYHQIINE